MRSYTAIHPINRLFHIQHYIIQSIRCVINVIITMIFPTLFHKCLEGIDCCVKYVLNSHSNNVITAAHNLIPPKLGKIQCPVLRMGKINVDLVFLSF